MLWTLVRALLAFQPIVFLGLTQYCYPGDQFEMTVSTQHLVTKVIEQDRVSGCVVLLTQLAHGTDDATSVALLGSFIHSFINF